MKNGNTWLIFHVCGNQELKSLMQLHKFYLTHRCSWDTKAAECRLLAQEVHSTPKQFDRYSFIAACTTGLFSISAVLFQDFMRENPSFLPICLIWIRLDCSRSQLCHNKYRIKLIQDFCGNLVKWLIFQFQKDAPSLIPWFESEVCALVRFAVLTRLSCLVFRQLCSSQQFWYQGE